MRFRVDLFCHVGLGMLLASCQPTLNKKWSINRCNTNYIKRAKPSSILNPNCPKQSLINSQPSQRHVSVHGGDKAAHLIDGALHILTSRLLATGHLKTTVCNIKIPVRSDYVCVWLGIDCIFNWSGCTKAGQGYFAYLAYLSHTYVIPPIHPLIAPTARQGS